MKVDELMIGNYVSLDEMTFNDILESLDLDENDIIPDRNRLIITQISEDGIIGVKIFDDEEVVIKDLDPIPSTDQWLLDFDFKRAKEEKDWFSIKTEIPFINLEISMEEKRCILFNRKKIVYTDIFFPKYVHNVQNLYFALTCKKLTR